MQLQVPEAIDIVALCLVLISASQVSKLVLNLIDRQRAARKERAAQFSDDIERTEALLDRLDQDRRDND